MELSRCLQLLLQLSRLTALTTFVLLAATLAGLHAKGYQLLGVQTGSMIPAFQAGDALVVAPASTRQLQPGQVISYKSPNDGRVIISHRLVNFDSGRLIAKGDALADPDPPVSTRQLVGQAVVVMPKFGYLLTVLRQPWGLAALVFLPAAAFLAAECRRLVRVWSQPVYHLYR